ncbi:MAG: nitroreductase family protein, partial [Prevotella sp.]|nr:nitroreductase family protein [Prevotella sp.]
METIKTRRSIRKYQKRDVDNTLLSQLLEEAERTQTMGNLQLYSVVATRNSEIKEQLAPAHFNQPMVTDAPVVLTFCADFRRTTLWAEQRQADPGYDNFLSFMNAATDALLFCQTFCNLAEEKGLGCCFLGTTV